MARPNAPSALPVLERLGRIIDPDHHGEGQRVRCAGERRCGGEFDLYHRFLPRAPAVPHARHGTVLGTACPYCAKTSWLVLDPP